MPVGISVYGLPEMVWQRSETVGLVLVRSFSQRRPGTGRAIGHGI
jgi:hypothetical protein